MRGLLFFWEISNIFSHEWPTVGLIVGIFDVGGLKITMVTKSNYSTFNAVSSFRKHANIIIIQPWMCKKHFFMEVAQWEIFMEQELGFGLDLVTFEAVFFMGKIFFFKFFLPMKTWKKRPQKLPNRPKSSPNLNSCSIKISHRRTSL